MEIVAFYAILVALWIYIRVTTPTQRRNLLHSGWALVLMAGATGFLWELAH